MSSLNNKKDPKVIAGPYILFDGSITAEFLQDDELDATYDTLSLCQRIQPVQC